MLLSPLFKMHTKTHRHKETNIENVLIFLQKPKATLPSITIHQMYIKKKTTYKYTLHIQLRHAWFFNLSLQLCKDEKLTQQQLCNIATQNWSLASPKQDDSLWTDRADDISCLLLQQLECCMCVLSPWQCDLITLSWPTSLWTHCPKPLCSQSSTGQWPALSGWLALSNHLDGLLRATQVISGESVASPQWRKENCILFLIYSAVY